MTHVTFVTTNPGKVAEARSILGEYGVRLTWRRRRLPEVQADDLDDVVDGKLDAVADLDGYVLIEDSGLFISSLGGFPGVYSAHFLQLWGFGPTLELLRRRERGAVFRCVAGVRRGPRRWTFRGEVRGAIAMAARGRRGFGYDPIFVPTGWTRTFAEVSPEEKDAVSHRARALRKVGEFLISGRRSAADARR